MQIWGAENTADYQANGVGGAIRGVVAEAGSPGLCGLARLGAVSGARIPQLMNLRNLAPTIQERILTKAEGQRTPMPTESALRRISGILDWREQTRQFENLCAIASERKTSK